MNCVFVVVDCIIILTSLQEVLHRGCDVLLTKSQTALGIDSD